jgi:hypothetical protein
MITRLGIEPLRPKNGHRAYAHLLTEHQVALIFSLRALDFDLQHFESFCSQFKVRIKRCYPDGCLPISFRNSTIMGLNFEDGLTRTVLQKQRSTSTATGPLLDSFSCARAVYCVRYEEYPNFFQFGFVDTCPLVTRLKEHAKKTGRVPIVVFVFNQTKNLETIHPEQLEIFLQLAIVGDLVKSGHLRDFDFQYVRECEDFGFYFNGSESDFSRVCFTQVPTFNLDSFSLLSTGAILQGNTDLKKDLFYGNADE